MEKTVMVFRVLKPAVLQDGVGGSALVALCTFAVIKGESCRTGNKLPPLVETSGASRTWRQRPRGGEWHASHEGCPAEGAQGQRHKAKLFFRGKGHRRTVPPAAPVPVLVPYCTLRDPTAPCVAPLQERVPSSRTASKEACVQMCSVLWSGLVGGRA